MKANVLERGKKIEEKRFWRLGSCVRFRSNAKELS